MSKLDFGDERIRWDPGVWCVEGSQITLATPKVGFLVAPRAPISRAQKGARGTARATDLGDRRSDGSRSGPARAKMGSDDPFRAFGAAQG